MIIAGHPFGKTSSVVYFVLYHLEDVIVAFLGMGNGTAGTILDAVSENECAVAFEQIERAPAEKAGFPLLEIVAGVECAVLVGEKLVVHLCNSSLGNFLGGPG
jgi:hypothetical protein